MGSEKGDEFVEILKRAMELLYPQYVAFGGRNTSESRISSFDTCSENNFSMGSSSLVDLLAFLRTSTESKNKKSCLIVN